MLSPDYELLFQNNHLGIAMTNASFQLVQVNRAFEKLLGYSREQLLGGMGLGHLSPNQDAQESKKLLRKLFSQEIESFEIEKTYIHADGSLIEALTSVTATFNANGELEATTAIVLDITERRKAERALHKALIREKQAQDELVRTEKLASLGALVAGIAHEVNTPLGSSLTIASSLAAKAERLVGQLEHAYLDREALSRGLKNIERGADLTVKNLRQAASLITNFKQVAVDRASGLRRTFQLLSLVDEVHTTLAHKAGSQVHFVIEVPADLHLDSYPGDLGRVLSNLIENALIHGFPDQTTGVINVTARHRPANGKTEAVIIAVSDDGVGIPLKNIDRVFDPFFTTRMGQGGSGLGLHVAYAVTHNVLGGHLRLAESTGMGATFSLEIPLVAPQQTACEGEDA